MKPFEHFMFRLLMYLNEKYRYRIFFHLYTRIFDNYIKGDI